MILTVNQVHNCFGDQEYSNKRDFIIGVLFNKKYINNIILEIFSIILEQCKFFQLNHKIHEPKQAFQLAFQIGKMG